MGEIKKFWLSKEDCSGCAACMNVCPQNAIAMEPDRLGFSYPVITSSCINCGICEKTCRRRTDMDKNAPIKVFAAWSKQADVRFNSTSGGLFSEIVTPILEENGYVVGASYDAQNHVTHIGIHTIGQLQKVRQSKYVQSDIGDIYRQIKERLAAGRKVAFCGTPCQVAGLRAYLNRTDENLLLIDFICRGVNSPKAYHAWLQELEKKYKSKINRVWFKYKEGGWKSSPKRTRLEFENGKTLVLNQTNNLYMCGYLGPNLYIRPSCGQCAFKGFQRDSDLTLADFWGIEQEYDDDRGTSLVMINSTKGLAAWQHIQHNVICREKDLVHFIECNPCFEKSVVIHPNSEQFLENLDTLPFSQALKPYYKKAGRFSALKSFLARFRPKATHK